MNLLRISSLLLVLLLEPAYGSRVEPKLFTRRAALCFTPAAGLLAAQPALADGEESVAEQPAEAELAELQRLQEQLAQLEGAAVRRHRRSPRRRLQLRLRQRRKPLRRRRLSLRRRPRRSARPRSTLTCRFAASRAILNPSSVR